MAALLLRRYLVDPPFISTFEWHPNQTFGASPSFVATVVTSYLTTTLLLHHRLLPLPLPSAAALRRLSALHNLLLLLLSLSMALGIAAASAQMPSPHWLLCFPPGTPAKGPPFFWAHVFYLSKLYELADTLLILLSGAAGRRRLTFLHVYHHAAVVVMCYVWLAARQSLMPVALATNAGVHVVMYGYYFSSSVGWRWRGRWKRAVTELQIGQFVFSFAASAGFLWMHWFGRGCEGMEGWLFNAGFNASLLVLFFNFHKNAYEKEKVVAGDGRRNAAGDS